MLSGALTCLCHQFLPTLTVPKSDSLPALHPPPPPPPGEDWDDDWGEAQGLQGSPSLGFLCRHWWDIGQGCWWNQSRINVSIMSGRGQWLPVGALSAPRGQGRTTGPPTDRHYGGSLPSSWATSRTTTAITAASYWGHRVVHEVPKPLGYSHLLLGNSVGPRGCRPESSKVPQHGSSYLVLTDS